jgi:hypothetical protein
MECEVTCRRSEGRNIAVTGVMDCDLWIHVNREDLRLVLCGVSME